MNREQRITAKGREEFLLTSVPSSIRLQQTDAPEHSPVNSRRPIRFASPDKKFCLTQNLDSESLIYWEMIQFILKSPKGQDTLCAMFGKLLEEVLKTDAV